MMWKKDTLQYNIVTRYCIVKKKDDCLFGWWWWTCSTVLYYHMMDLCVFLFCASVLDGLCWFRCIIDTVTVVYCIRSGKRILLNFISSQGNMWYFTYNVHLFGLFKQQGHRLMGGFGFFLTFTVVRGCRQQKKRRRNQPIKDRIWDVFPNTSLQRRLQMKSGTCLLQITTAQKVWAEPWWMGPCPWQQLDSLKHNGGCNHSSLSLYLSLSPGPIDKSSEISTCCKMPDCCLIGLFCS